MTSYFYDFLTNSKSHILLLNSQYLTFVSSYFERGSFLTFVTYISYFLSLSSYFCIVHYWLYALSSYFWWILLCAWLISDFFYVTYITLRQYYLTFLRLRAGAVGATTTVDRRTAPATCLTYAPWFTSTRLTPVPWHEVWSAGGSKPSAQGARGVDEPDFSTLLLHGVFARILTAGVLQGVIWLILNKQTQECRSRLDLKSQKVTIVKSKIDHMPMMHDRWSDF